MEKYFSIENGKYGQRMVLKSNWRPDFVRVFDENNIVELEINDAKGWSGMNLDFLEYLPNLVAITIIDLKIPNDSAIQSLHKLRSLELITYSQKVIDFSTFPKLEDCSLEWRSGFESVFGCKNLEELFVNRYSHKDTAAFGLLSNLKTLAILNSPIQSLEGLSTLKNLKTLRLANLGKLSRLCGIEKLTQLEELDIQKCKNISSISELCGMKGLRGLSLNDMGHIDTLKPVYNLPELITVLFYGTTNIVDGDLTPLLGLKQLERISFQNRKHYNHMREEFEAYHKRH